MSKARLIITAVVVERRVQAEVARAYGVSEGWVSRLVARYRAEGDTAFEPRSRRPKRSPTATAPAVRELIVELRHELVAAGLDAGADTIAWHLERRQAIRVHRATVHRILVRAGLVHAAPKKRPRASYKRFEASLPNECWQSDVTHVRLADSTEAEVLAWIDDCSRYVVRLTAHERVSGRIVLDEFRNAMRGHGVPASTLTDNGMVYTTRFSGGRGGRNGFEAELHRLGIHQKNSRANHPTTCGKVERFHQTLKRWLDQQATPATVPELQALLDKFALIYNTERPHRALPHRATPTAIYTTRPKAIPGERDDTHYRVRHDIIDTGGTVTLRLNGRLHHIGIGRPHARTHVVLLIDHDHVRVVHATTGELLRDLTIDTSRNYQPTGRPPGHPPKPQ
ncbi:MAG TPA: IS481 family transposase [Acidimicrobiia bacterium]|nr:IS481 family transposase [Acidimicrobiia bacterium]